VSLPPIAFLVSPHGFGHAARSSAVMTALRRLDPEIELLVFTTVPRWFFEDSVGGSFSYFPFRADVGLVQKDPFSEDIPETVRELAEFWAGLEDTVEETAATLIRHRVGLVVCDIAPLGIAVAEKAQVPSILVENFTWDWIYRAYLEAEPRLADYARRNEELNSRVGLRIQAEPPCLPVADAVQVGLVSREPRQQPDDVRKFLGVEPNDRRPTVLLTMGGMGWSSEATDIASKCDDLLFVTLGGADALTRRDNLLSLPDHSPIYTPDLIRAVDLVIGKLGYSTMAECAGTGTRFLFLERAAFPESPVLGEFARRRLESVAIERASFSSSEWIDRTREALARPRPNSLPIEGAAEIARRVAKAIP
jgi:hypothetical protein